MRGPWRRRSALGRAAHPHGCAVWNVERTVLVRGLTVASGAALGVIAGKRIVPRLGEAAVAVLAHVEEAADEVVRSG